MKIRKQTLGIAQTNTYYIEIEDGVIVVDPCLDVGYNAKRLLQPLENKNVIAILITHGHFDHISGIDSIVKRHQCPVYMFHEEIHYLKNALKNLSAHFGEPIEIESEVEPIQLGKLKIANLEFDVIRTPGHTSGSISYIIENNCFDGDFIMQGSVGRTDLPTGSMKVLKSTIDGFVEKYQSSNLYLYPGHGDITSLQDEILNNPYLK